jgi:thiol:disulfide interchange protein DsbD
MGCWIAVSVVTALYLLNVFRMPHDTPTDSVGPLGVMFSLSFLGLAAYISVGLFSPKAPEGPLWQQIVAFAPPQIEFSSGEDGYFVEHNGLKYALDFDAAVQTASSANKPMFLDFTGVNCINCRLMEKGVLSKQSVHSVLEDLVRVQLFVDKVPGVSGNAEEHERILNRNHDLQDNWLEDVAIPAYVIATPDGKEILAAFKGVDTSGKQFQEFLASGLSKWNRIAAADAATAVISRTSLSTN